jgi:hypothetical protein
VEGVEGKRLEGVSGARWVWKEAHEGVTRFPPHFRDIRTVPDARRCKKNIFRISTFSTTKYALNCFGSPAKTTAIQQLILKDDDKQNKAVLVGYLTGD